MSKTISLCMIVKNEEKSIEKCLSSVLGKVDEIIVVDTGSTDTTIDLASKFTDKIYHFEWVNDFSAARNYSLKFAKSDYILVLDADEYLMDEADLRKDVSTGMDYYLLKIENFLSYGGAFSHVAVRLFANNKQLFYHNRLHEHLNVIEKGHGFANGVGKSVIYHSGYTNEVMEVKKKKARNLQLMVQEVNENPNGYNLFNMAKTYLSVEDYNKAVDYFLKAYPLSKDKIYFPELLSKLGFCLGEVSRAEEGIQVLNDSINLFPEDAEMRFILGKLYMKAGYLIDAENTFYECLEIGEQGSTLTEGSGSYRANLMLAELYELQGKMSQSYERIIQTICTKKSYVAGLSKYFQIVLKSNVPLEAIYQNLELIYNISNLNELQSLLEVMYSLRHPLLNRYLSQYKLNVENNILAIAKQYDKEYHEAKQKWIKIHKIPEENKYDLFLLALILKDDELFTLCLPLFNLNHKETTSLQAVFENKPKSNIEINTNVGNILIKVSHHAISIQEFGVFQIIADFLLKANMRTRSKLTELLIEYGFYELAIDLLIRMFEEQPSNATVIRQLGDACVRADYFDDAKLFYLKLIDLYDEYSSFERCYQLYEKQEDKQAMLAIKEHIKMKYTLVAWVRNETSIL